MARVAGAITMMSLVIAPHAFAQTNQPLTSAALASAAEIAEQPQSEEPEQPAHTGFSTLVRGTASDFASFPRRQSTWVILAIGGAAAAAAHPIDDNVNARLQGSDAAEWFFAAGKVIGNGWVLGVRPSNRCDGHVISCCAPTMPPVAVGDSGISVPHAIEPEERIGLFTRRGDTA